jgi:hypothetical protein
VRGLRLPIPPPDCGGMQFYFAGMEVTEYVFGDFGIVGKVWDRDAVEELR